MCEPMPIGCATIQLDSQDAIDHGTVQEATMRTEEYDAVYQVEEDGPPQCEYEEPDAIKDAKVDVIVVV